MSERPDVIFNDIAESKCNYLSQWYLDTQMIITSERYEELHKVQQLLYKAIHYFVSHYAGYEHIFPVSDQLKRIVDICDPYPYRIGTYRPDFLIAEDRTLKICEVGARFPLNGYFMSGIAEYIGLHQYTYSSYLKSSVYESFLNYLLKYWGDIDKLYVLKGSDRPCDINLYVPFFKRLGIEVKILSPSQINTSSFVSPCKYGVINEFNQMEMDVLNDDVLKMIASSNALNDMRSIFLIHDKRFLAVLSDNYFLCECLSPEEVSYLRPYLIPTFTPEQSPEIWEEARKDKDGWVLKHCLLGKSEKVYAGCKCTNDEWQDLFDPSVKKMMVLQPFIRQQKIASSIKSEKYNDFAVGTLLCFNDRFFGTGIFRTSSFEITNRVDDRKMASCFTNDYSGNTDCFIL